MSLTTSILAYRPVPIEPLFRFCQELLGDPADQVVERHAAGTAYVWSRRTLYDNHVIQNQAGQGLDAILTIHYGADGPLVTEDEEELPGVPVLRIMFDTSYSWCSENASGHIDLEGGPGVHPGASDLHAYFVARVTEYLTEHRSPSSWYLEGKGEWFDTLNELGRLGHPERIRA